MASMPTRANPLLRAIPHFLTWRDLGFRTVCSGRLGFATQSEKSLTAGTKVLETFREEFEVGSRLVSLETGKIARFANGAVVLGIEETKVLSTAASSKSGDVRDFLPLTVDYQEKQFAQGVIPNTYMRREGAPKERELLCGRLIDRPIRPLFPKGFYHEVQVTASVLSCDGKQDPDVMAANATSAALMLSDIPWGGPIGMIRIGRIEGKFIVNPSMDELCISDLNLVYACTKDKTLMIDVQAREISEKDLEAGLRFAHPEAVKYLEPQIRLAAKAGKNKKEYKLSLLSDRTLERVHELAESPIEAVFTDATYGKFERGEALENITKDVKQVFVEEGDEESLKILPKAVDTVRKRIVRKRILEKGLRLDGRALDEVRPLFCESGSLPQLHGSSIFSRGDTQVLCTVTLGSPADAQKLESVVGTSKKRFMLHYSFPPFCINEVGKRGGMNRREVGHGTLAEKALLAVLPPDDNFPYTVRVNSEVMGSDGSTSMATVCGGSMALMDAGIPARSHVAGISVGLVSDVDPSTGEINDYRILTDILGLEDHLGDMDFKVAGTRKGVTAIQLDIKPAGIPLDIICESLEPARKGRLQILDHMEREINTPRAQDARNSPQIVTMKYSNESLRRLVGPLGALKRKIEEETGARISVSDGTLTVMSKNESVMDKVQDKIEFILGREIEIGGIYKGVVTTVKEYGAFVEFNGGQQGLLHISELLHGPVSRVSDVVNVGQTLSLMCIGQDVRGNIKLSLKAVSPQPYPVRGQAAKLSFPSLKEESTDTSDNTSEELSEESDEVILDPSSSSVPTILIRSAAECEEEEKAAGLIRKPKNQPKLAQEEKASPVQKPKSKTKLSRALVTEKKMKPVSPTSRKEGKGSKIVLKTAFADRITKFLIDEKNDPDTSDDEKNDTVTLIEEKNDEKNGTQAKNDEKNSTQAKSDEKNGTQAKNGEKSGRKAETVQITEKSLKLGTKVNAKVFQVRTRGLVLDLGGGLRGMYRFENGRTDFQVGEELRVQCSSFSSKGIPVVSLVDNEEQHR